LSFGQQGFLMMHEDNPLTLGFEKDRRSKKPRAGWIVEKRPSWLAAGAPNQDT